MLDRGSFILYARKFFEKLTFLPPDTHTYVFRKILQTYIMNDPLGPKYASR